MLFFAIQWSQTFFVTVLAVLLISVFVPWLSVVQRCQVYVVFLPAALATILWQCYEIQLNELASTGGPLDCLPTLILIYPLLAVTWISATLAAGAAARKKRAAKGPHA